MHQALCCRVRWLSSYQGLTTYSYIVVLCRYGWDLNKMSKLWQFDIYDSIRAVNWIRREVAKNRSILGDKELIQSLRTPFEASERPAFLSDDSYLQPYLPEDALLPALSCESWNEGKEINGDHMTCEGPQAASGAGLNAARSNGKGDAHDVEALMAENLALKEKLERQEALIEAVSALPCFATESALASLRCKPISSPVHAEFEPAAPAGQGLAARRPRPGVPQRRCAAPPPLQLPPPAAFHTEAARSPPLRAVQSKMQQPPSPAGRAGPAALVARAPLAWDEHAPPSPSFAVDKYSPLSPPLSPPPPTRTCSLCAGAPRRRGGAGRERERERRRAGRGRAAEAERAELLRLVRQDRHPPRDAVRPG